MREASVIICTYNRCESLADTLRAIKEQHDLATSAIEIIVVDNNSTDATKPIVEQEAKNSAWPIRYIFEPRQGKSYALNNGIQSAQGAILIFTDDDVVPEKDWIANILKAFRQNDADVVGGRILPIWLAKPPAWILDRKYWGPLALLDRGPEPNFAEKIEYDLFFGANAAFQKKIFEEVGFFRTDLGPVKRNCQTGDDTEMLERVFKAGKRILYAPYVMVKHKIPAERMTMKFFRRWKFQQGKTSMLRKPVKEQRIGTWLYRECLQNGLAALFAYGRRRQLVGIEKDLLFWNQLGQIVAVLKNRLRGVTGGFFSTQDVIARNVVTKQSRVIPKIATPAINRGGLAMTQVNISVIIATRNRALTLSETLKDLAGQTTHGRFTYEVVVADNGSTDDTRNIVNGTANEFPFPLIYCFEGNAGKAFALNKGIAASSGTLLAFTDDDVIIDPDWLLKIHEAFTAEDIDGVGGPVEPYWIGEKPSWVTENFIRQLGVKRGEDRHFVASIKDHFIGPNAAYRKTLFDKFGNYHRYPAEDVEWFYRIFNAGCKLLYHPGIRIRHKMDASRITRKYFARRFFYHGRRSDIYLDEQKKGRSLCGIPLWAARFFFSLHFQALRSWRQGHKDEAHWHWLRRYYYLGTIYYGFKDWMSQQRVGVTGSGRQETVGRWQ